MGVRDAVAGAGIDAGAGGFGAAAVGATGRAGLLFAAVFAASAAASAAASSWKCLRASSACSTSIELECVFFSVTPISGR
jgi:hypothetical protein